MAEKTKSYSEWLDKKLADPKVAANYLSMAYEDSHPAFLRALRKVSAAQGRSMTELANVSGVSRESLYRMLSEDGNPTSENERSILSALGFKVTFLVSRDETRPKPNKS
jgi:probable addiction module antidote protein